VATLQQRERLPEHIEEDERSSGQRRALQGVPAEEVAAAYRAVLAVLRDAFIEEAYLEGAEPQSILDGTRRLWDLTDRYSSVLVAARQQVDIDAARRDEQQRVLLLHRLLTGTVDASELAAGGAVHSILPDRRYWVLRARDLHADHQKLASRLASSSDGRPLIAPFEEDIAGLSVSRPEPIASAVIAVAGPATLTDIPHTFAEASRVLAAAVRYRRDGVVDSSSLSVRVAVEQQAELGEQLHRRYVGPLIGSDAGREILRTVRAYLAARRSVASTARSLMIHENTVRYRLGRFSSLTGVDLADTDRLVEVWWAFEHDLIRV
jgi:putative transposase